MKIGILGTGMVGQTLADKLSEVGHDVLIGTRNVEKTMARTEPDSYGNPPYNVWSKDHPKVKLVTFAEAAQGEVIINATTGLVSIEVLKTAGEDNLSGKVLMDIANPLDFSQGMPPSLGICNTDSLGEQIQKAFPKTKVVKTLNTMGAPVMVNPAAVAGGDHDVFVSGNDEDAKNLVSGYLKEWFGWKRVIDLGDITTARGTEMLLPIWVRLWGKLQTAMYNFKIAQ